MKLSRNALESGFWTLDFRVSELWNPNDDKVSKIWTSPVFRHSLYIGLILEKLRVKKSDNYVSIGDLNFKKLVWLLSSK